MILPVIPDWVMPAAVAAALTDGQVCPVVVRVTGLGVVPDPMGLGLPDSAVDILALDAAEKVLPACDADILPLVAGETTLPVIKDECVAPATTIAAA